MQKVPTSLLAVLLLTQGCVPFAGGTPTVTTRAVACTKLLPSNWKEPVEPPQMPGGGQLSDVVGDWISFADAAIGKLDVANGRTKDAIEIIEKCEALNSEAIATATKRKFLGVF